MFREDLYSIGIELPQHTFSLIECIIFGLVLLISAIILIVSIIVLVKKKSHSKVKKVKQLYRSKEEDNERK